MSLGHGDEDLRILRVPDDHHLLTAGAFTHFYAAILPDPVVQMNYQIPLPQLPQVVPRLPQHLGLIQLGAAETARVLVATEDLCAGQDSQLGGRDDKPPVQQAQGKLQVVFLQPLPSHQLLKALPLPGIVEEHDHPPLLLAPVLHLPGELLTTGLLHHEVPRVEDPQGILEDGRGKVLLSQVSTRPGGDGNGCG